MMLPVTYEASSDSSHNTTVDTSRTSAIRPIGIEASHSTPVTGIDRFATDHAAARSRDQADSSRPMSSTFATVTG